MTDRQNTIVCAFDPNSPRITAHHIYDWIYESLKLPETDVRMIQIDGPRRRVYINSTTVIAHSLSFRRLLDVGNSVTTMVSC